VQLVVEPLRRLARQHRRPELAPLREAWDRADLVGLLIDPLPDGRVGRRAALHLGRELLVLASEEVPDDLATPRGQAQWTQDLDSARETFLDLLASPALYQLSQLWNEAADADRLWLSGVARAALRSGPTPREDLRAETLRTLVHVGRLRVGARAVAGAALGLGHLLPREDRPALGLVERLGAVADIDGDGLFAGLGGNLLAEDRSQPSSRWPLLELAGLVSATLRVVPADGPPDQALTAEDLASIATKGQRFLEDPDHGIPRLADIVRLRLDP